MHKPDMILFDYGDTLLSEPGADHLRAQRALFPYVTHNPRDLTPEEVCAFSAQLFEEAGAARAIGFELHNFQFQRALYELLGIRLSIPWPQVEKIFWDSATPGAVMPGAEAMLRALEERGVRTGVISNISFSGDALRDRLDRQLPANRFEFVIASSEYMFRKPSPYLFRLALEKAALPADRVWFCGDNARADVEGAHGAGLFPVWYVGSAGEPDGDVPCAPPDTPRCPHLHIRHWAQLPRLLDTLS